MTKLTMIELRERLEKSWCHTSSYFGTHVKSNPSHGQCAVTALIIQDHFDGIIKTGLVYEPGRDEPIKHYWNQIGGIDIDLTWEQFDKGSIVKEIKTGRLSRKSKGLGDRYRKLKDKVENG